jgi:protein-export membrane protein SecD
MRHRTTWPLLFIVTALTVFSIMVVWPGYPQKYLPDWMDYPEGPLLEIGGREAMRLGLDLKGGTYVLTEADVSALPAGTDVDEAMDGAKEIIEDRINRYGVSETEVTREGKNRLAIQLPGIGPEEAEELIGRTALLRFMEPVTNEQGLILCETAEGTQFPLETSIPQNGICQENDQFGTVVWTPATGEVGGETRVLTGRQLRPGSAQADIGVDGPQVSVELTGEGAQLFEQITGRLVGSFLGIFLDEELVSAPRVDQQITGDQTSITGLGDLDEAKNLAIQLNAGSLPVPLRTIQTSEVDATLGDETLVYGVQAGIAGIIVIMLFMVLYYRLPGLLASRLHRHRHDAFQDRTHHWPGDHHPFRHRRFRPLRRNGGRRQHPCLRAYERRAALRPQPGIVD